MGCMQVMPRHTNTHRQNSKISSWTLRIGFCLGSFFLFRSFYLFICFEFHLLELCQNQFLGSRSWPGYQGRACWEHRSPQGLPTSTLPNSFSGVQETRMEREHQYFSKNLEQDWEEADLLLGERGLSAQSMHIHCTSRLGGYGFSLLDTAGWTQNNVSLPPLPSLRRDFNIAFWHGGW